MLTLDLEIKGTWAYAAPILSKRNLIRPGQDLKLVAEPGNIHDSNAVAVYIESNKLGHLPRELAKIVSFYIKNGGSYSIKVISCSEKRAKYNTYPLIIAEAIFHQLVSSLSGNLPNHDKLKATKSDYESLKSFFSITCPHCLTALKSDQEYKNINIHCGSCSRKFVYRYRINCPICGIQVEIKTAALEDMIRCKSCNSIFSLA